MGGSSPARQREAVSSAGGFTSAQCRSWAQGASIRLHTAGDRQRAAVSGADRIADGSIQRRSNPSGIVFTTLLVRQQGQAAATPARRVQQAGGYIRPKDNGLTALLAAGQ